MTPETLQRLRIAQHEKRPVVLATALATGSQFILPDDAAPEAVRDAASGVLKSGLSAAQEIDGALWFFQLYAPAYRLIIIGAVHIAQPLVALARTLGYDITVVDPRRGFNSEARFAGVTRLLEWPDTALVGLAPDRNTALVALTHDPKLDDPALDHALRTDCFYIGALGSRKSHAARRGRLAGLGHEAAALDRIRGPVGLAIGAVSAAEIALSILAEIVAARRGAALAIRS